MQSGITCVCPALSGLMKNTLTLLLMAGVVSQVSNLSPSQVPFLAISLACAPAALTILCFPVSIPSASPPDLAVAVQAEQPHARTDRRS